jgi:hypothetical protein
MSKEESAALAIGGLALIVLGHRLLDAELGRLRMPHALGAVLVGLALRVE